MPQAPGHTLVISKTPAETLLDIAPEAAATLIQTVQKVAAAVNKNSKSAPLDGRKRGTGGIKKKNLDEGEEAERIARLQQQLEQAAQHAQQNKDEVTPGVRGGGVVPVVHASQPCRCVSCPPLGAASLAA